MIDNGISASESKTKRPKVKLTFKAKFVVILAVGSLFLVSLFLFFSSKSKGWDSALSKVGREVAGAVIVNHTGENSSVSLTDVQGTMKALILAPDNAPQVVVYDFANKVFCGRGGCVFPVYERNTGKLVADFLLNPNLPQGIELFGTSGSCFHINQMKGKKVATINYCYIMSAYKQTTITYNK